MRAVTATAEHSGDSIPTLAEDFGGEPVYAIFEWSSYDGDWPVNAMLEPCYDDDDEFAIYGSREAAQAVIDAATEKAKRSHRSRPQVVIRTARIIG